jgi:hypothetical protein
MVFCFVHLDDACGRAGDEEVYVVVPETTKTVIALPLTALPALLPLLDVAVGGDPLPACPVCAASIPRFDTPRELL